jgi:hypothetical protein
LRHGEGHVGLQLYRAPFLVPERHLCGAVVVVDVRSGGGVNARDGGRHRLQQLCSRKRRARWVSVHRPAHTLHYGGGSRSTDSASSLNSCHRGPTTAEAKRKRFSRVLGSRASPPHVPREEGLAHPADPSRSNLAAALGLLSRWRLSQPFARCTHSPTPVGPAHWHSQKEAFEAWSPVPVASTSPPASVAQLRQTSPQKHLGRCPSW